jgi:hypothetical protein
MSATVVRLAELASVIRSKNAGPATLTLDLFFTDDAAFARAAASPSLAPAAIGPLYGCAPDEVQRFDLPTIRAIKLSVPRRVVAGTPGDPDAYGAQQHAPLLGLEV